MIIIFTEEEKEYLVTSKGNWHVKPDCPLNIKVDLEKKINNIYKQKG